MMKKTIPCTQCTYIRFVSETDHQLWCSKFNYELSGVGGCTDGEKRMTNADKIRTKNDYDLADWLAQIIDCCWNAGRCGECDEDCPMYNCCNNQVSDNIEDWLKQEATDGD